MLKSRKTSDIVNWININDSWKKKSHVNHTFVDLFSGAGGISKGFEMAGMKGIYGLDHYSSAIATYGRNFNHPIYNGDITKKDVKRNFVD